MKLYVFAIFFLLKFPESCPLPLKWITSLKYRFRPRILIDVSKIDMATTVLGFKISMPIMIAPTAMQKMAHPEGKQFLISTVYAFTFEVEHSVDFCDGVIWVFC